MAIISFDKEDIIPYVPAYGGNRSSDVPCVVHMRHVPYSRVKHYERILAQKVRAAGDDLEQVSAAGKEVQKRQFVESVDKVENYFLGEREVTDPAEFYETADRDLVTEIIKAMESSQKLSEGQRKN